MLAIIAGLVVISAWAFTGQTDHYARYVQQRRMLWERAEELKTHVEREPSTVEHWRELIQTLSDGDEREHALQVAEQAVAMLPDAPLIWCAHSRAASLAGDYQRALDSAQHALDLDAGVAEAHARRGFALSQLNRYDEAMGAFETSVSLDPSLWIGWNGLGEQLGRREQWSAAIVALKKGVSLNPRNAGGYRILAVTYNRMGRYREALDVARRSLHISEHTNAHNSIGSALERLGDIEGAAQAYLLAASFPKPHPDAFGNLTRALEKLSPSASSSAPMGRWHDPSEHEKRAFGAWAAGLRAQP